MNIQSFHWIAPCLLMLFGFENSLRSQPEKPVSPRDRVLLNSGWNFQKEDPADAKGELDYEKIKPWILPCRNGFMQASTSPAVPADVNPGHSVSYVAAGFDDQSWQKLNLPHDWAIEGPFHQENPSNTGKLPYWGVGWYRKHFTVSKRNPGDRYLLELEGVMSHAAVWLNGHLIGGWPYGYASFQLDLTPFLNEKENVLAIRVDNPKKSSRWYPGAGIYRDVWLLRIPAVHGAQWGCFVTTLEIAADKASVVINASVVNDSKQPAKVKVTTDILDGTQKVAASDPQEIEIPVGATAPAVAKTSLEHPVLWDLKNPHGYTAVTTITVDGKVQDRFETPFGVRSARFTSDHGFELNGRRVLIQGVCNHHDLGALGAAFNVRAAERQLEIMKGMGVNALRTSHNPPAPELLDLCDRMGILVMDEAFDCWKGGKCTGDYHLLWDDWHEADLRAFIRRDRNHPSVVLWSVGNEVPDQNKPEGKLIAAELRKIANSEDPTRSVTAGCDNVEAAYNGLGEQLDVYGFNYKPHEYEPLHQKRPNQPIFASESASTISSLGEYFFPVGERLPVQSPNQSYCNFQVNSYDLTTCNWSTLPDNDFVVEDRLPFVAGQFIWTGFDYLGEPSPYDKDAKTLPAFTDPALRAAAEQQRKSHGSVLVPSRSSYFGAVDLAGFKKDRFYLYQSKWRPDFPMAHILPHWNWPERVGANTPVFVYTSGDEAELFLNGKSLGRRSKSKPSPWPVNLAAGKSASAANGSNAAAAADGRTETRWEAPDSTTPTWWQVDLGSSAALKALQIDFGNCAKNFNYHIVSSDDGETWKPLVTELEAYNDQTHIDYPVNVAARFLRVEFDAGSQSIPAIKEFSAFAAPIPSDVDSYRLRWNEVVYEPGELKVIAYKQGKKWAEETLLTTGSATQLQLIPDHSVIKADGTDLSFVTVSMADKNGEVVPRSKNEITFKLSGPGEIVGLDNGDATSFEPFQGDKHHAWNGKCLVIIRSKAGAPGVIQLSAAAEGLASVRIQIQTGNTIETSHPKQKK